MKCFLCSSARVTMRFMPAVNLSSSSESSLLGAAVVDLQAETETVAEGGKRQSLVSPHQTDIWAGRDGETGARQLLTAIWAGQFLGAGGRWKRW